MAPAYQILSTEELEYKRQNQTDLLIIDLREKSKYQQAHIAGAVHFSFAPTWWQRLWKKRPLHKLLGQNTLRPIVFY